MSEYIYLERPLPKHIVKQIREDAIKDFAKWLIDKRVDNYSDIVDLVAEYTNNLEDIKKEE